MFKIIPLDNQVNKDPSQIPKHPFSLSVIASKGAGKTTLILNLLMKEEFYKGKFNDIYYVSPTQFSDEKVANIKNIPNILVENKPLLKILKKRRKKDPLENIYDEEFYDGKIPSENFISELTPVFLHNLLKTQDTIIQNFGKKNSDDILLVLDDSVSDKFLTSRAFISFVFKSRHHNISIILISQAYFSIVKPFRLNSSALVLFATNNKKELELIYAENNCGKTWEDWKELMSYATTGDFDFLTILYQNKKQWRFLKNFEEFLEND